MKKIFLLSLLVLFGFNKIVNAQVELIKDVYTGTTSFIDDIYHTDADVIYFEAVNRETNIKELWISDGTEVGTSRISGDLEVISSVEQQSFAYMSGSFFFYAQNQSGDFGVYRHNRSNNEVTFLKSDGNRFSPKQMFQTGNHVYFLADNGSGCDEVFKASTNQVTQVLFPAFSSGQIANCNNSITNRAIIEVFNQSQSTEETYFFDADDRLYEYSNGNSIDVFEAAGLIDQNGGSSALVSVNSDYFTIVDRKFIFHGSTLINDFKYGVFSLDLDTYNLETLVNYPGDSSSPFNFDGTGADSEILHYLHDDGGVYFLTLDETSSLDFGRDQIHNLVLYFSDGTASGTVRMHEFKDLQPNPLNSIVTEVHMQAKFGNTIVFKSLRSDGDLYNPELYSLNLQTMQEELVWDFTPSVGNTFDHFQGQFESGHAFFDYVESERNARTFFIGNGTAEGVEFHVSTTDDRQYELSGSKGLATINDSVFVFVGKLEGSNNDAIFKYVYNCDNGSCDGGSGDGGSGDGDSGGRALDGTVFYEEPFYLRKVDPVAIPLLWETTNTNLPNDFQFNGWITLDHTLGFFPQYSTFFDRDVYVLTSIIPAFGGSNIQNEEVFNEEIVSPSISISGKSGIKGSIIYINNPHLIALQNIVLSIDARVDNNWFELHSFSGNENAQNTFSIDTLSLKLNTLPQGDSLQFRFKYTARIDDLTPRSTSGFAIDKLILTEETTSSDSSTFEKEILFEDYFDVESGNLNELINYEERGWEILQSGVPIEQQGSRWRFGRVEKNDDVEQDVFEGISNNGNLLLEPYEIIDNNTNQPINYDELIASPLISLEGKLNPFISMNILYQPLVIESDEVTFNVLGRENETSEWQILKQIQRDPNQLGGLEAPTPLKLDIDLNQFVVSNSFQLGLRVRIENYQNSLLNEGYLVDSVIVYNRVPKIVTSNNEKIEIVNGYSLSQNYPNPFNPTSTIQFGIPKASIVKLEVFNLLGQKVKTLVDGRKSAGFHTVKFDAADLSSGMYIYRIQAGYFVQTKKMMLIK